MPPIPGLVHWHHYVARNIKTIKAALSRAARALDSSLSTQPSAKLEPALARNTPKQPLHPLARIRQSQSRWFSTARNLIDDGARTFTSSSSGRAGAKYDRAFYAATQIGTRISQSSGRAPFAHTLRPNLTGGTLGRTAGGYSLGSGRVGGMRYFSHTPASQAQVVHNVSQAVRAFFVGGQKAQFDGMTSRGEKRYKAVTALQEEAGRKMRSLPKATPGSHINFRINPTVTALTPLGAVTGFSELETQSADHLNSEGLLDVLSVDFSRALKDLAAVMNDLRRLSALGDLPITYEGMYLRVHFPGCDAGTVERLCEELNVTRGTVWQDEAFDAFVGTDIALLFPFAPSEPASDPDSLYDEYPVIQPTKHRPRISVQSMFAPSQDDPAYSTKSAQSDSDVEELILHENPWLSSGQSSYHHVRSGTGSSGYQSDQHSPLEYQGFEGIYRFIEELDAVRN